MSNYANGEVKVRFVELELAAAEVDTAINAVEMFPDERVLGLSKIVYDALGTDTTLDVGDDTDTGTGDDFIDGEATSSAGEQVFTFDDKAQGYRYTEKAWITVTPKVAAPTGTVQVWVYYMHDAS
jgi:hypothetical protein